MTNSLKQFKSFGLIAIAAIFLFAATLTSCDGKKENADSTEDNTEMKMDSAASEHPTDAEHNEHPANEEGGEHPASEEGGEEHPAN